MKHKVENLAKSLTSTISSWPCTECVLSCEASEADIMDPYFALVLDVYCDGPVPDDATRQAAFHEPGAFETSRNREKDRFFLDGLPVRLEYKSAASFSELEKNRMKNVWIFGGSGTYMLHRIVNGRILYQRTDWIDRMRASLSANPPEFWLALREAHQNKIEHCLSDLGGAAVMEDRFFYIVSLAGFIRACASALFAINHTWEPSERHLTETLMALPLLPEDFEGRWGNIVRTSEGMSAERRYEIAQLIARSVFALA